jgi:hypothetical protein
MNPNAGQSYRLRRIALFDPKFRARELETQSEPLFGFAIRTYLDGHNFDGETIRQMGIARAASCWRKSASAIPSVSVRVPCARSGRFHGRQRNRHEPRAGGRRFLGRACSGFQSQHEDFCHHSRTLHGSLYLVRRRRQDCGSNSRRQRMTTGRGTHLANTGGGETAVPFPASPIAM